MRIYKNFFKSVVFKKISPRLSLFLSSSVSIKLKSNSLFLKYVEKSLDVFWLNFKIFVFFLQNARFANAAP